MHPFRFLPGLQPGKEGQQGIISGVIRLKSFVEQFLKVGSYYVSHPLTGINCFIDSDALLYMLLLHLV